MKLKWRAANYGWEVGSIDEHFSKWFWNIWNVGNFSYSPMKFLRAWLKK